AFGTHMLYPVSKSGFGGNTSAMDPIRQDITAVLEECYSRGMQLPYLFVAVSLDGRVMGVRFTEAEDGEGLDAQPIAGNPSALATMPMPINVMIVDATGNLRTNFRAGGGNVSLLVTLGRSVSRTISFGTAWPSKSAAASHVHNGDVLFYPADLFCLLVS